MKTRRILMGALVFATMVAFIAVACNKERTVALNENDAALVSKEDDMNAYLKQFKERMQSASRGDETLSMEDARWHLEAVLNYTFGDAGYRTTDIQHDTLCYKLPTEGGKVSLAHLNEAFNSLSVGVEKSFAVSELPDKSILSIQTKIGEESKDDDVIVRVILSFRGYIPIKFWFDSTDYWSDYYNEEGHYGSGKCGPYSGQCMNSGAPKELGRLSNLRIPMVACDDNRFRTYVTDVEEIWLNSNENIDFMMDENSPCGYKIYYNCSNPSNPSHNPSHCIPPDDMNYYLSKFIEIMNHYQPCGKYPICATYIKDYLMSGSCVDDLFWLVIQYATIQCIPNGPEEQ